MTLAIAIKRDTHVDVYADTRLTGGAHGIQTACKIFEAHGSVYTFSGHSDMDAVFCALSTPRRTKKQTLPQYFNKHFAGHLEDVRKTLGEGYSFDFLAVDGGNVYLLQGVTMMGAPVDVACVGSGGAYAYGVIHFLQMKKKHLTDGIILDILRSVALHDESVGAPFDHWKIYPGDRVEKERYLK